MSRRFAAYRRWRNNVSSEAHGIRCLSKSTSGSFRMGNASPPTTFTTIGSTRGDGQNVLRVVIRLPPLVRGLCRELSEPDR